ncbi:MAG: hypothetical protein ACRDFB_00495 [Rhabdochlamydiaceae bacterium]
MDNIDIDKAKNSVKELFKALDTMTSGSKEEVDKLELEIYRKYAKDLSPMIEQLLLFRRLGTPEEIGVTMNALMKTVVSYYRYTEHLEKLCDENGIIYDKEVLTNTFNGKKEQVPKSKMN